MEKWKMENGKWKMENGKWRMENLRRKWSTRRLAAAASPKTMENRKICCDLVARGSSGCRAPQGHDQILGDVV